VHRFRRSAHALLLTASLLLGAPLASAEVAARLIVDPANTDGVVDGNLVTGLQPGDQVGLLVEIDNSEGNRVPSLFTVAGFDPTIVTFETGTSVTILVEEGFGGSSLSPLLQPELRFGQLDEAIVLAHARFGDPTQASTSDLAASMTFDVVGQDVASVIRHEISVFDESLINEIANDSDASPEFDLGSPVLLVVPEPALPSLLAIGLLGLAGLAQIGSGRRVRHES